jgi:hypothetical protein
MSVGAIGPRPSLHAAAKACKELPVSMQALYDKVHATAPGLVRALVQGSAARLSAVLAPMVDSKAPMVPGYQPRIVDGNHLSASGKRLKPLRGFRGAALPGQSLLVYDPDTDLVVELPPCEDGHAQERTMMRAVPCGGELRPRSCRSPTATSAHAQSCAAGESGEPEGGCSNRFGTAGKRCATGSRALQSGSLTARRHAFQ